MSMSFSSLGQAVSPHCLSILFWGLVPTALQLDSLELNLLYKDKYNVEVPDSYEHLLLDVIDGENHLCLRTDELAAAWNILTPVLNEIDKKNIAPELYELGGRGPVGAYYLWATHGIPWAEHYSNLELLLIFFLLNKHIIDIGKLFGYFLHLALLTFISWCFLSTP